MLIPSLIVLTFISSIIGSNLYIKYALRRGITAQPNSRNLHQSPTVRGGGIVFSFVFLISIAVFYVSGVASVETMPAVFLGGLVSAIFGFIDDVTDMRALTKFLGQSLLAVWILFCFDGKSLLDITAFPGPIDLAVSWLALVWFMNAYNFMDGSDGIAASGAIFFCIASICSLFISKGDITLIVIFTLLLVSCLGFILFNFPPASLFMGDSGSLFLGYFFGALIAMTVTNGNMSIWTWLVMLAYFLGDTTSTTITRFFLVKRWYEAHRSNAYQNLVRIDGSHTRVFYGILLFHFLYLLPLVVLSVLMPAHAPVIFILAYTPVIIWNWQYGPRFSSK